MELRLAREQEFLQVRGLYWDIIDQMARAEYRPGWKKGIYPSDQWIRAALREGSLYTAREGDALIGAMALDHRCAEGDDRAAWGVDAAGGAVSVIHALGVLPAWQGRGAGKLLVRGALETARQNRSAGQFGWTCWARTSPPKSSMSGWAFSIAAPSSCITRTRV